MGITQQIGASSIIKPGVIDNTAARPALPYEGQVIFQKDTDQLLVWNGTAWVIPNSPAQNPTGLEYITSSTVGTGVSTHTVSSCFSSTYDNYHITYSGGAGSALISLQVSLGASVTGYSSIANYALYSATTTPVSAGNNNASKWGFVGYASTNYSSMSFDLMGPFLAQYTTYGAAAWAAVTVAGTSSGIHAVATSYTGFTISPDTGTLTGGTVTVYGYRK